VTLHHEKEERNGGRKQMPLAGSSLVRTDDPADIMYPFTVEVMILANLLGASTSRTPNLQNRKNIWVVEKGM
jgi:hypothetical protein